MNRRETGRRGEDIASSYLEAKGYTIIAQSYSSRYGEIDIVAERDSELVFAEVKLRKRGSLVSPEESVTKAKQLRIIKTAYVYLQENPYNGSVRFDVIALYGSEVDFTINHIENAFYVEDENAIF